VRASVVSIIASAFVWFISGCSETNFASQGRVTIEGREIVVRQYASDKTSWAAYPAKPANNKIDDVRKNLVNVRAIETVSGCMVIAASVNHLRFGTTASVDC